MSARDDDPPAPAAAPRRLLELPLGDDGPYGSDPAAAWGLGLLRGAEPYRTPAGRKQRVQLRLGHTPRRRAPLVLRLAVGASVLLSGAAVVSAAVGRWPDWVTRAYEHVIGPRRGAAASAPTSTLPRGHVSRHVEVAPPVAAEVPWPEIPIESEAAVPARRRVSRPTSPPARAPRLEAAAAPAAGEDTSPVSAAMRALRVERNPTRARVLLARYLGEHPGGSLAEEALALSIEAALAHHDADSAALASHYLRLYPRGSFQALARQALTAQQPPTAGLR